MKLLNLFLFSFLAISISSCSEEEGENLDSKNINFSYSSQNISYLGVSANKISVTQDPPVEITIEHEDITFNQSITGSDYDVSSNKNVIGKNDLVIAATSDPKILQITFPSQLDPTPLNQTDEVTITFLPTAFVGDIAKYGFEYGNAIINAKTIQKDTPCTIVANVIDQWGVNIDGALVQITDAKGNKYSDIPVDASGTPQQEIACGLAKVSVSVPNNFYQNAIFDNFEVYFEHEAYEIHTGETIDVRFYTDGKRFLPTGVHPYTASITNYDKTKKTYAWGKNDFQQTGLLLDTNDATTDEDIFYAPREILNLPSSYWISRTHNNAATVAISRKEQSNYPYVQDTANFLGRALKGEHGTVNNLASLTQNEQYQELSDLDSVRFIMLDNYSLFALLNRYQNLFSAGGADRHRFLAYEKLGRQTTDTNFSNLFSDDNQYRGKLSEQDEKVVMVATSDNYSILLSEKNNVWAIGYNDRYQLGVANEKLSNSSNMFEEFSVQIENLPKNIIKVASGNKTSAAISSDGNLYIWGDNKFNKAAQTEDLTINIPTKYDFSTIAPDIKIVDVALYDSVYALTSTGKVLSWGQNDQGQLGHDTVNIKTMVPKYVKKQDGSDLDNIAYISSGYKFALFQSDTSSGSTTIYSLGANEFGQLGLNDSLKAYAQRATVVNMP